MKNTTINVQNTKKINKEFVKGDELLKDIETAVTIYGSARTSRDSKYYEMGVEIGEKLARNGFDIITGGGPGTMQAVNEGAYRVQGAKSIGLGIELPFETQLNQYTNMGYTFKYFFVRKVMMVKYAKAFISFPGGIGTLEELFETLTLMQTTKTQKGKVYLIGVDYYSGLIEWMKTSMLEEGYIKQSDLDMIVLTDDINMVVNELTEKYI